MKGQLGEVDYILNWYFRVDKCICTKDTIAMSSSFLTINFLNMVNKHLNAKTSSTGVLQKS